MATNVEEEFLSKEKIKKEYGFTEALIRRFLPEPEREKPNPFYSTVGAPMKQWRRSTVESVVNTKEFADELAKTEVRRASAKKAAEQKRQETFAEYRRKADAVTVKRVSLQDLRAAAVEDKEAYEMWKGNYGCCASSAPEYVQRRWMVNFVRHRLTKYDADLYAMAGKVGVHEGYREYKAAVLDKIAIAYPELASECESQKDQQPF